MSYTQPQTANYRIPAAAIAGGGVLTRIKAPKGKTGRVVAITSVVTTDVTGAASLISVTNGGAVTYATASVEIGVAGDASNLCAPVQNHEIAKDTLLQVTSDGGSTLGAADLDVLIAWY